MLTYDAAVDADAVVASNLTKRYRNGKEAVRGVSLRVGAGEIVGLLGRNGAGKSTTMNMLATLVPPTSGEAWVFGRPIGNGAAVKPLLGVALQATGLDPLMSVRRHFDVQAALYRIADRRAREHSAYLIDAFELAAVAEQRVGSLSGGTQRRLSLALALLHEPRVIVFEEPTTGLDPEARWLVWSLLEDLRDQGRAILFSTHYLEEADRLCSRIEVIADGRIVASGTPAKLKELAGPGVLRVRVRGSALPAAAVLRRAVRENVFVSQSRTRIEGDHLEVHVDTIDQSILLFLHSLLEESGMDIVEISWGHGTLEEAFHLLDVPSAGGGEMLRAVPVEHRVHARRG